MRDWLACPLSPTTSLHTKSDEGTVTDDEYAIVNPESSSELDISEVEFEQEETSTTWLSVLSIFGVAKKLNKNKSESKSSCSSSLNTTTPIEDNDSIQEYKGNEKESLKLIETVENKEDEGVHLYQLPPPDESYGGNVASTTTIQSGASTPVSSEMCHSNRTISSNKYLDNANLVKICWHHGGKKVQITGEFDNWSKPIDMVPDKENNYYIDLKLSLNKDIEFKFIIDDEWRYATDLPHRTDKNGNINNVIFKDAAPVR